MKVVPITFEEVDNRIVQLRGQFDLIDKDIALKSLMFSIKPDVYKDRKS